MSDITIKTNGHTRELKSAAEVGREILERDLDYLLPEYDANSDEALRPKLFEYRGSWYDVTEFEVAPVDRFHPWWGIQTESYFSAVLIRYPFEWDGITVDFDAVVVGYAHW